VRKAIEDLLEVSQRAENHEIDGVPEPVFYGTGDYKTGSEGEQLQQDVDVLEIDLDEDGPLREEYLPKRRISSASSRARSDSSRALPPPAKWSPAADEPIMRGGMKTQAQYLAPQPITHGQPTASMIPPPAPFHQGLDMSRRMWPTDEQIARHPYVAVHPPVYAAPPVYTGYEYTYPAPSAPPVHSRSQSLSYHPVGQMPGHYRSYSQVPYEHGCGEMPFSSAPYGSVRAFAPPQWSAYPNRAMYPPVYDSGYDYSRPLLKV
jgi:hypothetical protein